MLPLPNQENSAFPSRPRVATIPVWDFLSHPARMMHHTSITTDIESSIAAFVLSAAMARECAASVETRQAPIVSAHSWRHERRRRRLRRHTLLRIDPDQPFAIVPARAKLDSGCCDRRSGELSSHASAGSATMSTTPRRDRAPEDHRPFEREGSLLVRLASIAQSRRVLDASDIHAENLAPAVGVNADPDDYCDRHYEQRYLPERIALS